MRRSWVWTQGPVRTAHAPRSLRVEVGEIGRRGHIVYLKRMGEHLENFKKGFIFVSIVTTCGEETGKDR